MPRRSHFAGCLGLLLLFAGCRQPPPPAQQPAVPTGELPARGDYLFCFWNVENFFDDRDDHRTGPGDREYDRLFAEHPELLKEKLAHLTEALLRLNAGRGPDILALAEVESSRAAELLQESLNKGLEAKNHPASPYQHVLMKDVAGGRHIATAILTRLPVINDRTHLVGQRLRILEGHIVVDKQELIVIASHWTSQLKEDSEIRRDMYADKIYGEANAIYHRNRLADILVVGDFNETPHAEAITKRLHSTGDLQAVRAGGPQLLLFNPLADKDAEHGFGTHFFRQWLIYDQVLASPGLVDAQGWSIVPDSITVVNTLTKSGDRQKRPWHFGGAGERGQRGYSDHFPVTVQLRLHGS